MLVRCSGVPRRVTVTDPTSTSNGAKQPPYMAGVVSHSKTVFYETSDRAARPCASAVARSTRFTRQKIAEGVELLAIERRLAPGSGRPAEGRLAVPAPRRDPPAHSLPAHLQLSCDLGLLHALTHHTCSLKTTDF